MRDVTYDSRLLFVFYTVAHNIIENVLHKSVCSVIFGAWLQVTLDARRTREYFEVRGSGAKRTSHIYS